MFGEDVQLDHSRPRIRALLVEDDRRLAKLLTAHLEQGGMSSDWVSDGRVVLSFLSHSPYDVLLLDVMLPGLSGLDVCRTVRAQSDIPIIMISARSDETDRVLGIELGADDYLIKPFAAEELLARIRAKVRRARGALSAGLQSTRQLNVGAIRIDCETRVAYFEHRPLPLTPFELRLLIALAERQGRPLTREYLVELLRHDGTGASPRSIDILVSRLRRKLGEDPRRPRLLLTVPNAGYMLLAEAVS